MLYIFKNLKCHTYKTCKYIIGVIKRWLMFLSPLLLERYAPSSSIVEITSFFIFSFLGGGGLLFYPLPRCGGCLTLSPSPFLGRFCFYFPLPLRWWAKQGNKERGGYPQGKRRGKSLKSQEMDKEKVLRGFHSL